MLRSNQALSQVPKGYGDRVSEAWLEITSTPSDHSAQGQWDFPALAHHSCSPAESQLLPRVQLSRGGTSCQIARRYVGRRKNFSNPPLSGGSLPVREQKDERVWEGIKWVWGWRQVGEECRCKTRVWVGEYDSSLCIACISCSWWTDQTREIICPTANLNDSQCKEG